MRAVAELVLGRFPAASPSSAARARTAATGGSARVCCSEAGREVTVVDGVGDLGDPDVVVDALLGIGLEGPPREDAARMIELINAADRPIVAVDVPSGVNASTGEVAGAAVRAAATVTFGAAKVGLAVAPGSLHAGAVTVAPLGLRPREHEHSLVPAAVLIDVPRKQTTSTKYSAGSVLIVGGSRGPDRRADPRRPRGVPRRRGLRGRGSAGVDLAGARVGVARGGQAAAGGGLGRPSAPTCRRRDPRGGGQGRRGRDRPGLGRSEGTVELVRILLERLELPVVLDADALWELEPFTRAAPTVLTPHSGELAALLGIEARESTRTGSTRSVAPPPVSALSCC